MSTLRVNTLQNAAGTSDPAISGAAKAWVNFNGTGTVAIRASFNVSSITDNGTGLYTVNFTNVFSDTNYVIVGSTINDGQMGVQISGAYNGSPATYTTSAVRINTTQANTFYDCSIVNVAVFR